MNTVTIADPQIRPADLLIRAAVLHRPERAPDLQAEVAAYAELSQAVADDPQAALRRFLEVALRLCNAGTAGLSLLRSDGRGSDSIVHWEAVSGALSLHEGDDTPRNFSPCGLCLDAGVPILVSQPERVFTYLRDTLPAMVEDLIVPLYDSARRPLGTLWIAHHDSTSRFSFNDARIAQQLAIQLALTLELLEQASQRRISDVLEARELAQGTLAHELAEERSLRQSAQMSENGMRQALAFQDTVLREAHHRVKNTIQIASSLLSLQARTSNSAEVRNALNQGHARLSLLAKVHELLYMRPDSTHEILMPKLLQTITAALRQSFAEVSAHVRLQITADPIMLSADDAIPLALLANEMLTNAYKHAFAEGAAGEIIVSLRDAPDDTLILQVTDDGVGMPLGDADNSSGLGLKLMRSFAVQLRGTLTFARRIDAAGTEVMLTMRRGA